jgi:hypothetical protein
MRRKTESEHSRTKAASSQYPVDGCAMINLQTLASGDLKSSGIQPQKLQDGGVDVGDVMPIGHSVEADFVSGSMDCATFDSTSSHPAAETVDMMIATIGALRTGCAAEFRGEYDECFIEQSALCKIFEKCGDRLIHGQSVAFMIGPESAMGIPAARATGAVLHLNKTDTAFNESAGGEHLHTEIATVGLIDAISILSGSRFLREIDRFGHGLLHAKGKFV